MNQLNERIRPKKKETDFINEISEDASISNNKKQIKFKFCSINKDKKQKNNHYLSSEASLNIKYQEASLNEDNSIKNTEFSENDYPKSKIIKSRNFNKLSHIETSDNLFYLNNSNEKFSTNPSTKTLNNIALNSSNVLSSTNLKPKEVKYTFEENDINSSNKSLTIKNSKKVKLPSIREPNKKNSEKKKIKPNIPQIQSNSENKHNEILKLLKVVDRNLESSEIVNLYKEIGKFNEEIKTSRSFLTNDIDDENLNDKTKKTVKELKILDIVSTKPNLNKSVKFYNYTKHEESNFNRNQEVGVIKQANIVLKTEDGLVNKFKDIFENKFGKFSKLSENVNVKQLESTNYKDKTEVNKLLDVVIKNVKVYNNIIKSVKGVNQIKNRLFEKNHTKLLKILENDQEVINRNK